MSKSIRHRLSQHHGFASSSLIAVSLVATGILLLVASMASAQQKKSPPPPPPAKFGDPLPGLTGDQLAAFNDGLGEFSDDETPSSGLGPIFNRDSCIACHSAPAVGGSSDIFVTRFGRGTHGSFDPLTALGGSLLQERAIVPSGLEHVPPQANIVAHRQSTPLYGLGLIEAISDATILRGVRTGRNDGVKGRAAIVTDIASGKNLVGRFGWKAQQATLLSFAGDAYVNEMGITNRLFPVENAPDGNLALLKKLDHVADPEDKFDQVTGKFGIDKLADFMRYLAPPPPLPPNASNIFGAKLFLDVGCASCHTPMMMTGKNSVAALNWQRVMLYSDLLLHDMGQLADGIGQADAHGNEMKTAPLWGLRASGPYLHDGRAKTVGDAIEGHDGEAKSSREKYNRLRHDQQKLMAEFLMSI